MKWRIRADIILEGEDEAMDIFSSLKARAHKFLTINKGEPNEERSRMSIEKCYHDEDISKPCETIETVESE